MSWSAEEEWVKQHPDERIVIGVAVDGSSIGDKALAVAAGFFKEKRGDKVGNGIVGCFFEGGSTVFQNQKDIAAQGSGAASGECPLLPAEVKQWHILLMYVLRQLPVLSCFNCSWQ